MPKPSSTEGAVDRVTAGVSELRLLAAENKIDAADLAAVLDAREALGHVIDDVVSQMPLHTERSMTSQSDDSP